MVSACGCLTEQNQNEMKTVREGGEEVLRSLTHATNDSHVLVWLPLPRTRQVFANCNVRKHHISDDLAHSHTRILADSVVLRAPSVHVLMVLCREQQQNTRDTVCWRNVSCHTAPAMRQAIDRTS
jgi:hypothetical protein